MNQRETSNVRRLAVGLGLAGVALGVCVLSTRRRRSSSLEAAEVVTINEAPSTVFNQWPASGVFGTMELLDSRGTDSILWSASTERDEIVGDVRFSAAPGGRGTEVRVRATGLTAGELRDRLRKFKQIVETGEVTRSDGPALWRPAQPAESGEVKA